MQILDYDGLQVVLNNICTNNPNILINSDFKINQRNGYLVKPGSVAYEDKEFKIPVNTNMIAGYQVENIYDEYATTYTKNAPTNFLIYIKPEDIEPGYAGGNYTYTVDRWKFNNKTSNILNIRDNYVNLISNSDDYSQILQSVENYKDYINEVLTLSVKLRVSSNTRAYIQINDGVGNVAVNINDTNSEWKIVTAQLLINKNADRLYAGIGIYSSNNGGSIDIAWAKLEVGNVATKYTHPNPALELLKCKYYYQELYTNTRLSVINSNTLIGNLYYNSMRKIPIVKFKNNIFNQSYGTYIINGNIISGFTFELKLDNNTEVISVFATKESHGLNELNTLLVVAKKNPLCLNAEL